MTVRLSIVRLGVGGLKHTHRYGPVLGRAPFSAVVLALLCVLGGCGGSSMPPVGEGDVVSRRTDSPNDATALVAGQDGQDGRAPTAAEQDVIDQLARIAEHVRDLELVRPVNVVVQDRAAIVRYLTSEIEEDELAKSREVYVALGLLPPDMDVRNLLERVLGEQVVGYYDPEADRLVLRDDVMRALSRGETRRGIDEARVTIVHELVHAIQDQRLELGERFEDDDRDTDPDAAYHALVEGDATLAMIGYLSESGGGSLAAITRTPERLRMMMAQAPPVGDDELAQAPPILRVTLVSSYVDGVLFAAELHGLGGWRAVDDAHRHPPTSTEQILHPERFVRGEQPEPVSLPTFAELEASGLSVVEEDTLGELEMRVYLGQLAEDGIDEAAAEGWAGDRLRVYRQAGASAGASAEDVTGEAGEAGEASAPGAVVWFTAWDDEAQAREAEAAARRIALALPEPGRAESRVLRSGRAMLVVRNLAASLHDPVKVAFERFAASLGARARTSAATRGGTGSGTSRPAP